MNTPTGSLEEIIKKLPPHIKSEISVFIESLISKHEEGRDGRKLKQDWAGALRKCRERFSSLELQHKVSQWRGI